MPHVKYYVNSILSDCNRQLVPSTIETSASLSCSFVFFVALINIFFTSFFSCVQIECAKGT